MMIYMRCYLFHALSFHSIILSKWDYTDWNVFGNNSRTAHFMSTEISFDQEYTIALRAEHTFLVNS
jgi:hypothetical protein